ncbi:MAG: zinc-ribbon domain-containing protein [Candidatus Accumulibacter sp.]|nr:zinc-ribbon domain-containing protein [Accumulibacter sp.]
MRTCCPTCRTVFRVTPEQLRLRAGRVRCGQCRAVFNAIENLFDGDSLASSPTAPVAAAAGATPPLPAAARARHRSAQSRRAWRSSAQF